MILIAALVCSVRSSEPIDRLARRPAYQDYRNFQNRPLYDQANVYRLVAAAKKKAAKSGDVFRGISGSAFAALSTPAKFTYCMDFGEAWNQLCAEMPAVAHAESKIFSRPPLPFGESGLEEGWSDRQTQFFQAHRAEVIHLVRDTIRHDGRVGTNLKNVIVYLRATDLIPDLVVVFNKSKKDLDILSTLANLMNDGGYAPFQRTPVYHRLYGSKASYQNFVPATPANEALILANAMAYCTSLPM